jgi:hypothetical protein
MNRISGRKASIHRLPAPEPPEAVVAVPFDVHRQPSGCIPLGVGAAAHALRLEFG